MWLPPPAKTVDVEVESKVEKLEVVCQRSENLKHDPTEEEKWKVERTNEKLSAKTQKIWNSIQVKGES